MSKGIDKKLENVEKEITKGVAIWSILKGFILALKGLFGKSTSLPPEK